MSPLSSAQLTGLSGLGRPNCAHCGCRAELHVKHSSTGKRPCNAFRPRDLEPGEQDHSSYHTDEDGKTWRPCHCADYTIPDKDVVQDPQNSY